MCVELGSLDQVRGLQQQLEQLSPAELAAALAEADDVIANLRAGRDLRNSGSKIRVFFIRETRNRRTPTGQPLKSGSRADTGTHRN